MSVVNLSKFKELLPLQLPRFLGLMFDRQRLYERLDGDMAIGSAD